MKTPARKMTVEEIAHELHAVYCAAFVARGYDDPPSFESQDDDQKSLYRDAAIHIQKLAKQGRL